MMIKMSLNFQNRMLDGSATPTNKPTVERVGAEMTVSVNTQLEPIFSYHYFS
jgi:hypothetical protein